MIYKIAADKNQFAGCHGKSNAIKHASLKALGAEVIPTPLPFGDYCLITDEMQETITRRGTKLKKQDLVGDIELSIDSKKDLLEVAGNICSGAHGRFRDEIILAQKVGAKMIILVEEPGIKCVEDVFKWQNPRTHRYNTIKYMHKLGKWQDVPEPKAPPTPGPVLAKAMLTCSLKYGCEWRFCSKENAGREILKILAEEWIDVL